MSAPNDTQDLPQYVALIHYLARQLQPTPALVKLLVTARNGYDWPAGTGAYKSQQNIQNLEASVVGRLAVLSVHAAHAIVTDVSQWAGNNAKSHADIVGATSTQQGEMQHAISNLCIPGRESGAIDALCNLPGIGLVIASKIFRFCAPQAGAAVDRHASYFFNSLPIINQGMACYFVREWSTSRHTNSRLAIYSDHNYNRNRTEYVESYLPLLAKIANELNIMPAPYKCAVTNLYRSWTPADVEMAAYYWWARNGSR